ncbi:hypothetical protein [Microbacterium sp. NIBRBAC000506063]|uniref:hypothetical protein n=1 Tax=Microbacterium sp. NIBRBAC000506063 TaxID=2734618 RepID=UPI002948B761|nr:hypothetical protein [Microbacterium sp. NIBRBAC000506063]
MVSGFWGSRKKERAQQAAQDADLARSAKTALVAADERIRLTQDEYGFALAELGEELTEDLKNALESVRTHMGEAFRLHQLLHDEIPDTPEEQRGWNSRILQLCEWAQTLLDEKTSALEEVVARVRRAPEIIAQVRADADSLEERIAPTRQTIERLSTRYADSAMAQVAASADEAAQLLAFARHGADVSERRRSAGRNPEANLALETATEAVRRARALLESVEDFEINALRAESTLTDIIADSRADIADARRAPQAPAVIEATAALESALGGLVPRRNDPFAELSALREANDRLERAVAAARHRAENPPPRASTSCTRSTTPTGSSASRGRSSPGTAAGSGRMPARAWPRPSGCARSWPPLPTQRIRANRRCTWHAASRSWPPRRCISPSATSTRPARSRTGETGAAADAAAATASPPASWAGSSSDRSSTASSTDRRRGGRTARCRSTGPSLPSGQDARASAGGACAVSEMTP